MSSAEIYERLLRGEASSEEYVAVVQAEARERLHAFQRDRAFWAASASRERQRLQGDLISWVEPSRGGYLAAKRAREALEAGER